MKTLRTQLNAHRILIGSIAAFVIAAQPAVQAAVVFTLANTTYSQNFDGMGTSATVNALPGGWGFNAAATYADATTDTTRGAGSTGTNAVASGSAGGAYMLVSGVLASGTDKSIGYISSSGFSDNRNILFGFVNNTGSVITELSLSFDYEKYRSGTATRDWAFFGSTSDTAWGSAISAGAQSYAADANNTTVSNPPSTVSKTVTLSGLTLAAGANYYFRWNYDGSGTGSNAQALSLDNFSLTATLGTVAADLYFDTNGNTAGIGGTGSWDTTSTNWNPLLGGTGTVTTITSASKAIFGDTAGTVTVDAGGVTASGGLQFDTGGYTVTGGTLTLGNPGITTAHATGTTTISSVVAGAVGLQKLGVGTLELSGENIFTGAVAVNAGTLKIAADGNLGSTANALQLGGGKLQTTASVSLAAGRTLSGSGSIEVAGGQTLTVPGAVTLAALTLDGTGTLALTGTTPAITTLTMAGASTVSSTNTVANTAITTTNTAGTATISAALDFGATSRTITVANGSAPVDLLLSGALAMTGTSSRLAKLGDGALELTGTNAISGLRIGAAGTTSANGGTVIIHDADDLGGNQLQFNAGTLTNAGSAITTAVGISIGAGQIGNGATFTGSAMTFQGPSSLFKGTGSTYQHKITANSDVTFAGDVTGGLDLSIGSGTSTGLTIAGTGTVSLPNAVNTITENITVDGGNLEISGALTGTTIPSITTQNLGILRGNSTGARLGAVIAGADGLVDPGTIADSTGTLSIGNFTVQATGGLNLDLGGTMAGSYDSLNVTGTVTLSGILITTLVGGYVPGGVDALTVILNDGTGDAVSGTFTGLPEGSAVGATGLFITYAGGDGNDVVLTTVPEPTSAVLMLSGLALLGARRRRR